MPTSAEAISSKADTICRRTDVPANIGVDGLMRSANQRLMVMV